MVAGRWNKRRISFAAAAAIAFGVMPLLAVHASAAVNGAAQLSLPWAGEQNGSMTSGPHNWSGLADPNHPWNSLDWVPSSGQVFAARGGIAHTNDCGGPGFVRIDHGDGYQTTYYHLTSVQVSTGQYVDRGQWIGNIGTSTPCGGSASGAHTHFSLWHFSGAFNFSDSQGVDWNGTQIGAWVLDDGNPQAQYNGCITPVIGGTRQCPSTLIRNDWPSEQVAVAQQPPGRTEELFVRGVTLHGYGTLTDVRGTPYGWVDFGGIIKGSPSGVFDSFGTGLDAFAVGTDDRVWHVKWTSASGWGSWGPVPVSGALGLAGTSETESVNVDRRPDGGMDLFIRGPSGDAQHASLDSTANLNYWESLGGYVKGAPSGRWNSLQTRMDVYAIGSDNRPYHKVWSTAGCTSQGCPGGSPWGAWTGPLTGMAASAGTEMIMAVRRPDATMDLFIRGTDNAAWHAWTDVNGNILGWESLGGVVKGAPDGKWDADQTRLDVFAIGSDDSLYQRVWTSAGWGGWGSVSGGGRWG
jgi:Peptidase family M23